MDPLSLKAKVLGIKKKQCTDYLYDVFMKITWQIWLPWQPFMKKFQMIFPMKLLSYFNEISCLALI